MRWVMVAMLLLSGCGLNRILDREPKFQCPASKTKQEMIIHYYRDKEKQKLEHADTIFYCFPKAHPAATTDFSGPVFPKVQT